jgi:hypothetical protein
MVIAPPKQDAAVAASPGAPAAGLSLAANEAPPGASLLEEEMEAFVGALIA